MKHSIVLASYNGSSYISEAIESVLTQIDIEDELIIIDDASTDNTQSILANISDSRLRLIKRNVNGGISLARNEGLQVATGDYISFIDHDDLWTPLRHETVNKILTTQDRPDIISGQVKHFYSPEMGLDDRSKYRLPPTQSASLPGTMTISRHLFETAGSFDKKFKAGEFIDLMSRIMLLRPVWKKVDQVFQLRRIHGNNYTHTHTNNGNEYLSVVRAHILRKRGL